MVARESKAYRGVLKWEERFWGDDTYLINAVEMILHALDCMVLPVLHILSFKHLQGERERRRGGRGGGGEEGKLR